MGQHKFDFEVMRSVASPLKRGHGKQWKCLLYLLFRVMRTVDADGVVDEFEEGSHHSKL